jgi:hypothetical protein
MDSKVMKLAVGVFISLVALIGLIVYLGNAEKIDNIMDSAAADSETSALAQTDSTFMPGEQIGNDLQGFISKKDFFDEAEELSSVYSAEVTAVSMELKAGPGSINVSIRNSRGGLETGRKFTVSMRLHGDDRDVVSLFTDDDRNGLIEIKNLQTGEYVLTLQPIDGCHVPVSGRAVEVTEPAKGEDASYDKAESFIPQDAASDDSVIAATDERLSIVPDKGEEPVVDIDPGFPLPGIDTPLPSGNIYPRDAGAASTAPVTLTPAGDAGSSASAGLSVGH